ncbi:MAG: YggS family pyridoxal phosphate enzyme [Bacteroidetes bacterium GWF2_40_14]|nr:MAG: YggS family pyridoxal phosphate enzyme [Bacteroidetes bacterium GWF2_40_14]
MTIVEAISEIQKELPPTVKLVAVSKFKSNEAILEAYAAGLRDFAENRPQELKNKMSDLPGDINWHFIGHLQTNKIKMIIDKVFMVQSIDNLRLAMEVNKEAEVRHIVKDCLIQIHIAREETKQGFSETELLESIIELKALSGIRICGLMGMASFIDDSLKVKSEFSTLRTLFLKLKDLYFKDCDYFREISMGMSGDYNLAIEEGSTIVRIGTKIFGNR